MKKMCFSERFGLHDTVLEGRKTHTRRLIPLSTLAKIEAFQQEYYEATLDRLDGIALLEQYYFVEKRGKLPFKTDDIVAVAQRYASILDELEDPKNFCCMGHWESANGKRAHYAGFLYHPGFMNKMFVDAEEMPHQIRIKRVWFEYLQDISNEDCLKEGIDKWTAQGKRYYGFFDNEKGVFSHHPTPRDAYAHLIERISGKGTWASNPLVIAYEFERVK
jgi:hypothetical protein